MCKESQHYLAFIRFPTLWGLLYTIWDNTTHYKTYSVHFLGLMNSTTTDNVGSMPCFVFPGERARIGEVLNIPEQISCSNYVVGSVAVGSSVPRTPQQKNCRATLYEAAEPLKYERTRNTLFLSCWHALHPFCLGISEVKGIPA